VNVLSGQLWIMLTIKIQSKIDSNYSDMFRLFEPKPKRVEGDALRSRSPPATAVTAATVVTVVTVVTAAVPNLKEI